MTTLHSNADPESLRARVEAQHQRLVSLVQRICAEPMAGDDIDDILSETISTLLDHMEEEMAYLEKTDQPEARLETRRAAHHSVIEDIANFSFATMEIEHKEINRASLCDQVRSWVRSHHGDIGAAA